MENRNIKKRLGMWAVGIATLLLIPLVLTLLGSGVDGDGWRWTPSDFVAMSVLLFGSALTYELISRNMGSVAYRTAVGVGVAASLLLVWMNGAVGIIGSEDNVANAMYFGVILIGAFGGIISRFKSSGMVWAMFAMALAQALVPIITLIFWPQISWGEAGVLGVFILNSFFVVLFAGSASLFQRASEQGI